MGISKWQLAISQSIMDATKAEDAAMKTQKTRNPNSGVGLLK